MTCITLHQAEFSSQPLPWLHSSPPGAPVIHPPRNVPAGGPVLEAVWPFQGHSDTPENSTGRNDFCWHIVSPTRGTVCEIVWDIVTYFYFTRNHVLFQTNIWIFHEAVKFRLQFHLRITSDNVQERSVAFPDFYTE